MGKTIQLLWKASIWCVLASLVTVFMGYAISAYPKQWGAGLLILIFLPLMLKIFSAFCDDRSIQEIEWETYINSVDD